MSETPEGVLRAAIDAGVTPGAALRVVHLPTERTLLALDLGRVATHPAGPPVRPGTRWDLASLTKLFTATVVLRSVRDLDVPVAASLPRPRSWHHAMTWRALLEHRAGLPAWRALWEGLTIDAGGVLERALDVAPDADGPVYSDLGFLTLGAALGLDVLRDAVRGLAVPGIDWAPGPSPLDGSVAATEVCPRRGLLVGEVHDDNAWAMGGVAPHAGLFGTADGVAAFAARWWHARDGFLPAALRDAAWGRPVAGTHVLGWDTVSAGASSAGSLLSRASHGHLGFTGTSLWVDPERAWAVVLLTNRVHPSRSDDRIRGLRPALHDAVVRSVA